MQVVKPPIRQIQAKFSIKAQTHPRNNLWNSVNETCAVKQWNSCWVDWEKLQFSQVGTDVAILSDVLAWLQLWELQGICWFCCPSFCSRKERASGLTFGKCTAVHNKHLSLWAPQQNWLGLTHCTETSQKHIIRHLSASLSTPEAPSASFSLRCCRYFSFSAVHFCLPRPPSFKLKTALYFCSELPSAPHFFLCSSSTIPSRWCETLDLFPFFLT